MRATRAKRMLIGVATAVMLALGSLSPSSSEAHTGRARADAATGDAVRAWNVVAVNTLTGLPGQPGAPLRPPRST